MKINNVSINDPIKADTLNQLIDCCNNTSSAMFGSSDLIASTSPLGTIVSSNAKQKYVDHQSINNNQVNSQIYNFNIKDYNLSAFTDSELEPTSFSDYVLNAELSACQDQFENIDILLRDNRDKKYQLADFDGVTRTNVIRYLKLYELLKVLNQHYGLTDTILTSDDEDWYSQSIHNDDQNEDSYYNAIVLKTICDFKLSKKDNLVSDITPIFRDILIDSKGNIRFISKVNEDEDPILPDEPKYSPTCGNPLNSDNEDDSNPLDVIWYKPHSGDSESHERTDAINPLDFEGDGGFSPTCNDENT